ncbi:hypothetical protein [Actinomyces faecalis]|uniref:hypothetical protein n=1 Tax=Actinomyces faecalis TaxID=2722820 RepID=UPI0015568A96|nr:hypothetical protein [Actinomyces faecalis]
MPALRPSRRALLTLAGLSCTASLTAVVPAASAEPTDAPTDFLNDEDTFKQELQTAFSTLFSVVLTQDSDGAWSVNQRAASQFLPGEEDSINALCEALNVRDGHQVRDTSRDAAGYARCVVLGAIGVDSLFDISYRQIADWIWSESWKKVADYLWPKIAKHAGKVVLKGAVKFSPGGLAIALARAAVECVWAS